MMVGCAKEKENQFVGTPSPVVPVTPIIPGDSTNGGTGGSTSTGGSQTTFTPVSTSVFNEYLASRPLNNPQQMKIRVNLTNIGDGKYAGEVRISYYDNGYYFEGKFVSGQGTNNISYHDRDKGKSEAEFNRWFTWNGKTVFHGFFQDLTGAIVLVIDDGIDFGDGAGPVSVNGSVWFKNFGKTYAPQSPYEKCWFIRTGPYNCRTFQVGGEIVTTSALYPGDGYKKLGTFTNLNKPKAFGEL